MIVISAPFGNRICLKNCIRTYGSFTVEDRGHTLYQIWRVLRTVRYFPRIKSWVNKLGLPNPGIDNFLNKVEANKIDIQNSILSISARNTGDWQTLILKLEKYTRLKGVELNCSCPNCGDTDSSDYKVVFECANRLLNNPIVKLPPINYLGLLTTAYEQGIRSYHCCNTIPTPGGGLSGKALKPFSIECCQTVSKLRNIRMLIGGGGVTCEQDVIDYQNAGATDVAVGSGLFFPWNWPRYKRIATRLFEMNNLSVILMPKFENMKNN